MSTTLKAGMTLTCKLNGEEFLLERSLIPGSFVLLFSDGSCGEETAEVILQHACLPCSYFGRGAQ